MTSESAILPPDSEDFLNGKTVRIVGSLQSTFKKDVYVLIRKKGGRIITSPEKTVDWLILGKREGHFDRFAVKEEDTSWLTDSVRDAIESGTTHIATETQLLQRLFPSEKEEQDLAALYTPTMLAQHLNVRPEEVRRWYLHGLIAPVRVIRRLPYFDLEEVYSAQKINALLSEGAKLDSVEKMLRSLRQINPSLLTQLNESDLVVDNGRVLLRKDDELLDRTGQLMMDFGDPEPEDSELPKDLFAGTPLDRTFPLVFGEHKLYTPDTELPQSVSLIQLREAANACDEAGKLAESEEIYRNILFASGANASDCFQLGDLLHRQGNLTGARERFSMAIELDEDFVEARVELARVLSELGDNPLAVAALQGAIAYHPQYAEAYLQLALILKAMGLTEQADEVMKKYHALSETNPGGKFAG